MNPLSILGKVYRVGLALLKVKHACMYFLIVLRGHVLHGVFP